MNVADVEDIYELSPLQEGILFHTLYAPASGMYVEQLSFVLHDTLDAAAYERAWQAAIDRHPALRTSFDWAGAKPLQIVSRRATLPVTLEDWRALAAGEREQKWQQLLHADVQGGFDLSRAPLLRMAVARIADDEHRVVLSVHHLVLDGWSSNHVHREVALLYAAEIRGAPLELPPVRPFGDYISWLQSQEPLRAETFWRAQLAGYAGATPLDLGVSPAGAAHADGPVDFREIIITTQSCEGLRGLARRHQLTLNTLLRGAWALLLSRYTGDTDIVFGATVSGRPADLDDVETMIGLFINTLPVRAHVPPEASLIPWLTDLQAAQFEAKPFEYASLAQIHSWSDAPRDRPLFETLLAFENFPVDAGSHEAAEALQVRYWGRTNYPLSLMVLPAASGLLVRGIFDRARFTSEAIDRLLGHLAELLAGFVENPTRSLSAMPLLTAPERAQLATWNATSSAYPREATVHELFEEQARLRPDAVAVSASGLDVSYAELNARANRLAARLRRAAVAPETVVAVCTRTTVDLVAGMLGVLKAGGAYLPLDPGYPVERLAYMLEDSGAVAIVTSDVAGQEGWGDVPRLLIDDADAAPGDEDDHASAARAGNLAYVMYTSGSTGRPKGAEIPHRAILRTVRDTNYITLGPGDAVAQASNVCFDAATFEIWGALLNGARLVSVAPDVLLSPDDLADLLERERITVMFVTTDLFHQLMRERPGLFAGLDTLLFGGSASDARWVAACLRNGSPRRLVHVYGPTESTTFAAWYHVEDVPAGEETIPIGYPLANTQLYVVAHDLTPLPAGVPGEIVVGGDGVARGYLGRAEMTAEKFVADSLGSRPGGRLYRTGDRGRQRSDGAIEFLGRFDDQVKIRGFRVELGEIEAVLRTHPSVAQAVVLARSEATGSRRLVAHVVGSDGGDARNLREFLERRLPGYMVPSAFVFRSQLPLTPNGKVDRKALAVSAEELAMVEPYAEPRTAAEQTLAGIWAEVLNVPRVGIHDNFFELGGDSILSIQIVARARDAALELTLRQLFENQTIAALAAVTGTQARARAEQGRLEGDVPLNPVQRWFFDGDPVEPHHFNQASFVETPPGLDDAVLAEALSRVMTHHDALRLRYRREDGGWRQFFSIDDEPPPFTRVDLTATAETDLRAEIERRTADAQSSLDLEHGPLCRVVWFDLGARAGRLLFVVHHLAVDSVSWRILTEDLWYAYERLARGEEVTLPDKTSSVRQWAVRLRDYAESAPAKDEVSYWLHEAGDAESRLPVDREDGEDLVASARLVTTELSEEETRALVQDTPRAYQTQINDLLLTALGQALRHATGSSVVRFDLEGHGREPLFDDVDLTRTVGWFTAIFPVRLEIASEHPADALRGVKEQLRRLPNRGVSYGVLRYLSTDPEIVASLRALPIPDLSFNYLGQYGAAEELESAGPPFSARSRRRHLIDVNAYIAGGCLRVLWEFSESRHQRATVAALAADFTQYLRTLIAHCGSSAVETLTPGDFAQARISQKDLSKLLATVGRIERDVR